MRTSGLRRDVGANRKGGGVERERNAERILEADLPEVAAVRRGPVQVDLEDSSEGGIRAAAESFLTAGADHLNEIRFPRENRSRPGTFFRGGVGIDQHFPIEG